MPNEFTTEFANNNILFPTGKDTGFVTTIHSEKDVAAVTTITTTDSDSILENCRFPRRNMVEICHLEDDVVVM